MPYDNQHSHVFLVDINSIGEYKYKPGVKKVGKYLKETVQLASHSVQTLIKSVGVITCSQSGVSTPVPLSPLSSSVARNVAAAARKMEVDLENTNAFGDKDKARRDLKSALVLALGYVEGLDDPLEIHLLSALSVTEVDILLVGAKAAFKNDVPLKAVNLISPRTDIEDLQDVSALFCVKSFSHGLELESHLRSALVCQPGDNPDVTLELGEGSERETLSLDLHPRSVTTADVKAKKQIKVTETESETEYVTAASRVETAGVCQSLLSGAPLLALPTSAVFLSCTEKEDNSCKVSSLYRQLTSQANSLVLTSAECVYILTPCSDLGPAPSFLMTEALTAATILPFPQCSTSQDKEDTLDGMMELVDKLPHQTEYNPLLYSKAKSTNRTRGRGQSRGRVRAIKGEVSRYKNRS